MDPDSTSADKKWPCFLKTVTSFILAVEKTVDKVVLLTNDVAPRVNTVKPMRKMMRSYLKINKQIIKKIFASYFLAKTKFR